MRLRWKLWEMRWFIIGAIFFLVGIYSNDIRSMLVGMWMLLDHRISVTREYLDLQVLEMETRLASGTTRVWVRHER